MNFIILFTLFFISVKRIDNHANPRAPNIDASTNIFDSEHRTWNVPHENINKWPPLLLRFSSSRDFMFVKWTPIA